jgi:hypothetical protein
VYSDKLRSGIDEEKKETVPSTEVRISWLDPNPTEQREDNGRCNTYTNNSVITFIS